MPSDHSYRNQAPALWPLYGRSLRPRQGQQNGVDPVIPPLKADVLGMHTDGDRLDRYRTVCGFANRTTVPATWIHILAFPLHLKLLTDPQFPLPLLGLVHLRNEMTQWRPIGVGECVDLQVAVAGQTATDKGLEFDLVTTAWSAGRCVWEERSTNLFRQKNGGKTTKSERHPQLPDYPQRESIQAPESIGRRYGKVSGDLNPIHMHALSARVFGFPRAIAHGMWSKARCLAILEQQPDWRAAPVTVSCQFKKPLFLPGSAELNWQNDGHEWPFQLLNATASAPHLSGTVRWL